MNYALNEGGDRHFCVYCGSCGIFVSGHGRRRDVIKLECFVFSSSPIDWIKVSRGATILRSTAVVINARRPFLVHVFFVFSCSLSRTTERVFDILLYCV